MPATPTGLATVRPLGSCRVGLSAPNTGYAAVRPTASQVTGRQRGDSDRPVGNSSSGTAPYYAEAFSPIAGRCFRLASGR